MAELSLYKLNQDLASKAGTSLATTSAAGLMSSTDKTKLDGIATNANNYNLPIATALVLGGVKIGTGVSVDQGGTISVASVTTTSNGLMSYSDKVKLDSIATNANNYTLPKATTSALGGVMIGSGVSIDGAGKISVSTPVATTNADGLMSSTDKAKLDSITAGANTYTLPKATAQVLGGVMIGSGVNIDASGTISVPSASIATTSAHGLMSSTDKSKLDGIATNANNYVHPANHPASMIITDTSNRFVTDTQITQWNNAASGSHTHSRSQITDFAHTHAASDIVQGTVANATTATTANNIPTADVGGNIWVAAGTVSGLDGTSGAVAIGTVSAPVSPVTNQIWFDLTARVIKFWDGTAWRTIS